MEDSTLYRRMVCMTVLTLRSGGAPPRTAKRAGDTDARAQAEDAGLPARQATWQARYTSPAYPADWRASACAILPS